MSASSRRYPLIALVFAVAAGILLADVFPFSWIAWSLAALLSMILATTRWRLRDWALVAAVVCLGGAMHEGKVRDPLVSELTRLCQSPRVLEVRGAVMNSPKGNGSRIPVHARITALKFGLAGEWKKTEPFDLFIRWPATRRVAHGDSIEAGGSITLLPLTRNPGVFDLRTWLFRKGITLELSVSHERDVLVTAERQQNWLDRSIDSIRAEIGRLLSVGIEDSSETITVLRGIMLGDLGDASEEWLDDIRASGLMHLFAVSGLNIGMMAAIGWFLVAALPISRTQMGLIVLSLVLMYAAVAGLSASVVRATIMTGAVLVGLMSYRRGFLLNSIAGAALLILLLDTNELFQPGFQLSFLVVFIIAMFGSYFVPGLTRGLAPDPFIPVRLYTFPQKLRARSALLAAGLASTTVAAWAGSMPLIAAHFHLVSPVALIANLPAVPLGFVLLSLALMSIVAGALFTPLAGVFNNASWLVTQLLTWIVNTSVQVPGGHFYVGYPEVRPADFVADVRVFDLGRGSAMLVRTETENWMIDCGEAFDMEMVITPSLRSLGIDRLEGVIITDSDREHSGGLDVLVREFHPRTVVAPGLSAKRSGLVSSGEKQISLGAGCMATEVYLPENSGARSADDLAAVYRLELSGWSLLYASDAGFESEAELLERGVPLQSTILVAGRHARDPGGTRRFRQAVRPSIVVAESRGGEEQYSPEEDGAVLVRISRSRVEVEGFASRRRVRVER